MNEKSSVIVDAHGKPAKRDDFCPQCGQGKEFRKVYSTYGAEQVICACGYEFPET